MRLSPRSEDRMVFVLLVAAVIMFLVMIVATPAGAHVDPFGLEANSDLHASVQPPPVEYVVGQYFTGSEFDTAMSIISCESNFVLTAKNPTSTALGPWQFLKGTWAWVQTDSGLELDDYPVGPVDWEQSTAAARWLRDAAGWTQWSCYGVRPRVWVEPVTVDLVSGGRPPRG